MRVLSGIQPSGRLHIGNYFGAMQQHLDLQNEHEGFYFIADYHALTSTPDPKELGLRSLDVAMDYLALGLVPDKTVFWRQSDLPHRRLPQCPDPAGTAHRHLAGDPGVGYGTLDCSTLGKFWS